MKKLLSVMILILLLNTGCGAKDTVTITADPNSYTPLMSSVQGIALTPVFETEASYKNLVYHWETAEGEFISYGKEVNNDGEPVVWSAIDNESVAEINNDFDITLEVIEGEKVLAAATITITVSEKGFYTIKE